MFSALIPNTLVGEGLLLAKGLHWSFDVLGELWADHKTRKTPHTAHEQDATGTQTRVSLGKICAHAHTHTALFDERKTTTYCHRESVEGSEQECVMKG